MLQGQFVQVVAIGVDFGDFFLGPLGRSGFQVGDQVFNGYPEFFGPGGLSFLQEFHLPVEEKAQVTQAFQIDAGLSDLMRERPDINPGWRSSPPPGDWRRPVRVY